MVLFKGEYSNVRRRRRMTNEFSNSQDLERVYDLREAIKRSHTQSGIREQFITTYGQCQTVQTQSIGKCFRDFLRIYDPQNDSDFQKLLAICSCLLQNTQEIIFNVLDESYYLTRRLAYICIEAVYHNRHTFMEDQQLLSTSLDPSSPPRILLKTLVLLIDPKVSWCSCKIVKYLLENNAYNIFRDILFTAHEKMQHIDREERARMKSKRNDENKSLMETVLCLLISHNGSKPCVCHDRDPQWGFISILTIQFLWLPFPELQKIYVSEELCRLHLDKLAKHTGSYNEALLSVGISKVDFFIYVCLLSNLMEAVGVFSAGDVCPHDMHKVLSEFLIADAHDWRLPLLVFVPTYRDMFIIRDHPKLRELKDKRLLTAIKLLIHIMDKVLYQILFSNPVAPMTSTRDPSLVANVDEQKRQQRDSFGTFVVGKLRYFQTKAPFEYPSYSHVDPTIDQFLEEFYNENPRSIAMLEETPLLVPFKARVCIYQQMISQLKVKRRANIRSNRVISVTVRRDEMPDGSLIELSKLDEVSLQLLSKVNLIDEDGLDNGGLYKEFLTTLIPKAFVPQYGLFKETKDQEIYPDPESGKKHSQHMKFSYVLGVMFGNAMLEGILVDVHFATFFLNKLTSRQSDLYDLLSVDPDKYAELMSMKDMDEKTLSERGYFF